MARLILVTGPSGAGKTTYSLSICEEIGAIRFSIDHWMQTLYSNDMTTLDYAWMLERVERCYVQIWQVSEQILALDGNVVLDLGFTTKQQRRHFIDLAKGLGIDPEVHYLNASQAIRKQRIKKRNLEKDPSVYSFEVTDFMFSFMEPRYEVPDQVELENGLTIES